MQLKDDIYLDLMRTNGVKDGGLGLVGMRWVSREGANVVYE